MIGKHIAVIGLVSSLLAIPCAAQSHAEQLQKAIYAQDTTGDLAGAIQIYRQILSSPAVPKDIAAQAQVRVAQSQIRLLAQATPPVRATAPPPPPPPPPPSALATVKDGRYHNIKSGTEFTVPAGWDVKGTYPSSDNGEQALMTDSVSKITGQVWMIKETNAPDQVKFWLQNNVGMKIAQRHDQGVDGYWVRAESVQEKFIGGKQAISAVADYVERGQKMVEYMVWINTENSRVFFFARGGATDFPGFQARFDEIINSALVP